MRLETLSIDSFGALADMSFDFAPNLNIILGPNEAGKSTLFAAVLHTLLTPSRLTKKQFQAGLQRFLPAGGGDTIGCSLAFTSAGQSCVLTRHWGSAAASELQLPAGGRLTDEAAITTRLERMLPAPEGTLRRVLLTSQSGLGVTLQELESEPGIIYSLSDLLHKTLLETDGVSVARLQGLLERTAEEYFGHWDRKLGGPEGNRGPGNPYKKGVGRILAAWYARENLRRLYGEALEQEDAYGSASRSLEERRRALADLEHWLQEQQGALRDARERGRLEAEQRDSRREEEAVRRDVEQWPVLLERKKNLEEEQPTVSARQTELAAEEQAARALEQGRELAARLERIRDRRGRLEEAEKASAGCKPLSRGDLQKLRELQTKQERLAAGLEAGRVQAVLRAKSDLAVSAQIDLREPEDRRVGAGGEVSFEAGGRIFLEHPDWSLELVSGTSDFQDMSRAHARAGEELRNLLARLNIATLEEAERLSETYEEAKLRVESARRNLEAELGTDSIEELERAAGAATAEQPLRPLADILAELVKAEHRAQELRRQLEETEAELKRLCEIHGGRESLWEKLGGLSARTRELDKNLEALTPLPEGFADASAFIAACDQKAAEADQERRSVQELEISCARLEEKMPEESSEELEIRLREAESTFDVLLEKGEAVERIRGTADSLVAESSQLSAERYGDLLAGYIRETTGGAYQGMQVEELLPAGLVRENGGVLPASLLSAGTLDTLALSLRLAMAELFLTGREGFLVLDDPLVDLDPERQQLAAAALAGFAENKQLLLFTCHPGQAELFPDARRLEMARL